MIQHAIIERSRIDDDDPHTERPLTSATPWEIIELKKRCATLNAKLADDGRRVAKIRTRLAVDITKDEFDLLHAWERGMWAGDRPRKDRHYVVATRTISAWETMTT